MFRRMPVWILSYIFANRKRSSGSWAIFSILDLSIVITKGHYTIACDDCKEVFLVMRQILVYNSEKTSKRR